MMATIRQAVRARRMIRRGKMHPKQWYLSTKIWLAVAAALASLAGGLPDLGEASPVIRSVLAALTAIIGAWVIVLRVFEGRDPDSPESPIASPPRSGRATMDILIIALVAVIGTAPLWASCGPLSQREQGAVHTGVTGGVGLTCDVLEQLFPDNGWIRIGCKAGEILAVGVLAATMSLDADGDVASKAASVDVFEPGASPTLHMGCGAWALRCQRYGSGVSACGEVLGACELGISSVLRVERGE